MNIAGELRGGFRPDGNKLFNFVVPTYKGENKLEVIINCLLCQTSQNFHITVVSDGQESETLSQLAKYFNLKNFSYYWLQERHNDWGHTPRIFGLNQSDCLFTIMTGFDNYYMPVFVDSFEKKYQENNNAGFIYCDFVLNHPREDVWYNKYMDAKIENSCIDIGCFAARTELVKKCNLRRDIFAADWHLIQDMLPLLRLQNLEIKKVNQTLYVHN